MSEYGQTKMSISEFQQTSLRTMWAKRKKRVMHCLLSLEVPTAKAIADELGLKPSTVGRILKMRDFREALDQRIFGWMDIQAVSAMRVIADALRPEMPDGIRVATARWIMERRDYINDKIAKRTPPPLPGEDEMEKRLREAIKRRNDKIAAKAIEAKVVEPETSSVETATTAPPPEPIVEPMPEPVTELMSEPFVFPEEPEPEVEKPQEEPCPIVPGSSTKEIPPPSSEASDSGPTPESAPTSRATSSSVSASKFGPYLSEALRLSQLR